MTLLWDQFVTKLRNAGATVEAIQHCSEEVLNDLIHDLGFNALHCAQLQTEWKQRVKLMKPHQGSSTAGGPSTMFGPRVTADHLIGGSRGTGPLPLPYHSQEFAEVAQHALSYHQGVVPSNWAVVAVDVVNHNSAANTHADGGVGKSTIVPSGTHPGDVIFVMPMEDNDIGHLISGSLAVHTLFPIKPTWTAQPSLQQMKLVVGVVNIAKGMKTRTPNRIYLKPLSSETASSPRQRSVSTASGPGATAANTQRTRSISTNHGGSSDAGGAGGVTVPLQNITAQQLAICGYDAIIVEDSNGTPVEYRVSSLETVDVRYIVTIVNVKPGGAEGKLYCEKHPDHIVEFWDPVESMLTCAVCHLRGDSKKHPCVPVEEAAAQDDSTVQLWVDKGQQQLDNIEKSRQMISQAKDNLEVDYRKNVANLNGLIDTLRKELEDRRDEMLMAIEEAYDARRMDLMSTEQKLESMNHKLKETMVDVENIKAPVNVMKFRRDVTQQLAVTVSIPSTLKGNVLSRPLSWDAHLRFESEAQEIRLPVRTRENVIQAEGEKTSVEVTGGIIHWVGTSGGKKDFANPHTSGDLVVTASQPFLSGDVSVIVSQEPQECRTKSELNGWIGIDLGSHRRLLCKRYALRHGHEEDHAAMRDWVFEASNDTKEWHVLRRHKRDLTLQGPFGLSTYTVDFTGSREAMEPYRFFRIRITGPNRAGTNFYHIEVCELDVFGTLYVV
eukprot:PhF_6_TR516/c0_g1_i1/m.300